MYGFYFRDPCAGENRLRGRRRVSLSGEKKRFMQKKSNMTVHMLPPAIPRDVVLNIILSVSPSRFLDKALSTRDIYTRVNIYTWMFLYVYAVPFLVGHRRSSISSKWRKKKSQKLVGRETCGMVVFLAFFYFLLFWFHTWCTELEHGQFFFLLILREKEKGGNRLGEKERRVEIKKLMGGVLWGRATCLRGAGIYVRKPWLSI